MATRTTTSSTTTTKTLLQEPLGGKSVYRYDNVTISQERRKTRGETAGGLLTTIGQLQMVGISILVLSIGASVAQFEVTDLVVTTPNYNVQNTYIPIDDPLNNVNYIQYGEDVFNRFFHEDYGFIIQLGKIADVGNNIVACYEDVDACFTRQNELLDTYIEEINNPAVGTFIDEFGSTDFLQWNVLASSSGGYQTPYHIYELMTTSQREFVLDEQESLSSVEKLLFNNYTPAKFYLFGFTNPLTDSYYWGYFVWPSIYEIILELGV